MPRRTSRTTSSLFAPPGEEIYLPITYRAGRTRTGQVITRAARQEPAQQTRTTRTATGRSRYQTYLPTVSKTTQQPRDYSDILRERGIYLPVTMRTGETTQQQAAAAGYTPQQQAATTRAGTTRAATYQQAPPGIERGWYQAFQQEHEGQTPEEYYGGEYGLAEALADREWSQGFQKMYGRAPSDYDWAAWYYQKTGTGPRPSRAERRAAKVTGRRKARKAWATERGWESWGKYEQAIQEGWAKEGETYAEAVKRKPGEKGPKYVPPRIYWR